MKFAFVVKTKTWLTQGEKGWVDKDGKHVHVSADAKHTKFYKDEASAKAAGYIASGGKESPKTA